MYTFDFGAVLDRAPELLWGSLGTVGLALAGMLLALVIGLLGVVARSSKSGITRAAVIMFVEVVRNTPMVAMIILLDPICLELAPLRLDGGRKVEGDRWRTGGPKRSGGRRWSDFVAREE